jgi:hypothetical protein
MRTNDVLAAPEAANTGELAAGDRVGSFVVKAIARNGLLLRGCRTFAMWQVIGGLVTTLLGLCAWASVFRGDSAKTGAHGKVLLFPLTGIVWTTVGFLQFGEVWQFDADRRKFGRNGFFRFESLAADQLNCVRLTALPTNLRQRETLVLEIIAGPRRFPIGRRRTSKHDAANLITLAERISSVLQLPIEVIGELNSAAPTMRERFEQLAAEGPEQLQRAA